jgi:hypothetical protein
MTEATRQPSEESPKAAQAWADYVALGPDRSLAKLIARYRSTPEACPTTRLQTLKRWSAEYGWQDRLHGLAAEQAAIAEARERRRIDEIMATGFANVHERVRSLNVMAEAMFTLIAADGGFFREEVKMAANGEHISYQIIDKAKFDILRGLHDDLAKETGGRKTIIDATIKDADIEAAATRLAARTGRDKAAVLADLRERTAAIERERKAG